MATKRSTKDLARRIDPGYFRVWHRLRRMRFRLSAGLAAVAAAWIAIAALAGDESPYSPGPVASGHVLIESDCGSCHTAAFGTVLDSACLMCHQVPSHTGSKGEDPDCAVCHVDHQGRGGLTFVGDGHCNACHAEHSRVTSFETHLRFKRMEHEQHIRFDHVKHMAAELLDGPLACGSCHRPDASARGFLPIRYSAHCARCHNEPIDAALKDEIVPHGLQADELSDFVSAVYVRRMRDEPGLLETLNRRSTEPPDWTATLKERTTAAVEALFKPGRERGCLLCHSVTDRGRIQPPAIPVRWMRKADFDHQAHASGSCERCHTLRGNDAASVLALPGIGHCQKCHRPAGAGTTCTTCHRFHTRTPYQSR